MANNYKQPGSVIDAVAPAALDSGEAFALGAVLAVAMGPMSNGATGSVQIEGVFELPCASAADIGAGDKLTWDVSAGEFILTGAANGDLVGCAVAVAAAGTSVTAVLAKLTPGTATIQSGG